MKYSLKVIAIIFMIMLSSHDAKAQMTPQYDFYGMYDLSFLGQNASNDADEIVRTDFVLLLGRFFELEEKNIVDLHYRLYELKHTSTIAYETVDKEPLDFHCVDSVGKGLEVDFGSSLICQNDSFELRFASPITRIDPHLFSNNVSYLRLPSSNSLSYISSSTIFVNNLARIEGKDVVDNRFLISKDGTLIVAAVAMIESCVVPDGVRSVGAGAFQGGRLEVLNLPTTTIDVGENALANCPNLKILKLDSDEVVSIHESCFENTSLTNLTIYVPKKTLKAYKKAYPALKGQFKSIK